MTTEINRKPWKRNSTFRLKLLLFTVHTAIAPGVKTDPFYSKIDLILVTTLQYYFNVEDLFVFIMSLVKTNLRLLGSFILTSS